MTFGNQLYCSCLMLRHVLLQSMRVLDTRYGIHAEHGAPGSNVTDKLASVRGPIEKDQCSGRVADLRTSWYRLSISSRISLGSGSSYPSRVPGWLGVLKLCSGTPVAVSRKCPSHSSCMRAGRIAVRFNKAIPLGRGARTTRSRHARARALKARGRRRSICLVSRVFRSSYAMLPYDTMKSRLKHAAGVPLSTVLAAAAPGGDGPIAAGAGPSPARRLRARRTDGADDRRGPAVRLPDRTHHGMAALNPRPGGRTDSGARWHWHRAGGRRPAASAVDR
eukprot:763474-Hanusia_phi.AAC.4